jgi:hypothetical protein
MRWEHPQLGMSRSQVDYDDCGRSAQWEAWRLAAADPWPPPRYYRRGYYDPFPSYRDPWYYERSLQDYCMRAKGYQLVPAPAKDSHTG